MSSRWERAGEPERLARDMGDLAVEQRIGAVELTEKQRREVLVAAAELAGEMAKDLPWPTL